MQRSAQEESSSVSGICVVILQHFHPVGTIRVNQPYHGLVLSPYGTKAVSVEDLVYFIPSTHR